MGPDHNTKPKDILNYMVECIGHNAKLFLYMPWREWAYQPIRWGALVDLDGNPTERLDAAGEMGEFIQRNADFIHGASPPAAEVALVESKENAIFIRGANDEELLYKAQRGAYRAFWDQGYSVDFITADQLRSEEIMSYQYICLPLMGLLSLESAARLAEFVRQGGVLIGFSRLAWMDERGWTHHQLPISGLREAFGLEKIEADTLPSGIINFGGKEYPPHLDRDLVTPAEETEILGYFADGQPAVTAKRYGKGIGIFVATQADSAFVQDPQNSLLGDVIDWAGQIKGLKPKFSVEDNQRAVEIDPHILEFGNKSWVLFSNYSKAAKAIEFELLEPEQKAVSVAVIFPAQRSLSFNQQDGAIMFNLSLEEKEVGIVEIIWQE